jgi:hypothetical protein
MRLSTCCIWRGHAQSDVGVLVVVVAAGARCSARRVAHAARGLAPGKRHVVSRVAVHVARALAPSTRAPAAQRASDGGQKRET